MTTSILLTGASGLVGTRLTDMLLQKGYQVAHLGRSKRPGKVPSYVWNVAKGEFDPEALNGVDAIIHLAGAGVAEKRWTSRRKKEILESRTKSSALLYETLKKINNKVRAVVSASAIGYYGFGLDEKTLFTEESKPGNDYLSRVVVAWEREVDAIASLGIRIVKIRIGIVLSDKGGALKEMAGPIKIGIGSPLGSGKQILSWIHLDDLCAMFIRAVEDESMKGAYNAVSPQPVTNRDMTIVLAKVLNRPLLLPPVPAFVLRIMIGEMTDIVVNGRNVSSEKIRKTGFTFKFTDLKSAFEALFQ